MQKYVLHRCLILLCCLIVFSCQAAQSVRPLPLRKVSMVKKLIKPRGPVPLKVKLYQMDTIMIVWWDYNNDGQCDSAYLYEKKDGYFVQKKIPCDRADEIDQFILEPRV